MNNIEDIFPNWERAREHLIEFVGGISGYKAICKYSNRVDIYRTINICFVLPFTTDKNTGEKIQLLDTFPVIHRQKIKNICYESLRDRIPDSLIEAWEFLPVEKESGHKIEQDLHNHERTIISQGHMSIKEDLAYRFGIFLDFYRSKWDLK